MNSTALLLKLADFPNMPHKSQAAASLTNESWKMTICPDPSYE